ncbi:cytochrome b/b6 domain-containing protein [Salinibacterium soli]|uniref:Cytochrome b/b6 domain-containing protein n=1 Tax=Antiquaquibacter soli TaxID=3064523 RepID=A0ABT9BQL1_9MICO|nr:cytochrome b/b6 domain-containing protein [Protaetiibacter sp. WY-16]MDO7883326.1 cytochrome b/b6 domain-containing protein [Protaetiibacter sp. WY-16]
MTEFRKSRWFALVWAVPAAVVVAAGVVILARFIRDLPAVQDWLVTYPGHSPLPAGTPEGFPWWLGWLHFLNSLFMLLIVRTGWQIHTTKRHEAYWTRNNSGLIRTKNPPTRLSLPLWFHLSLDTLWVLTGVVYVVLIFASGHWARIVPTSWDVFPNAISTGLQYATLEWPTENGWEGYNALQLLLYFVTVFIAAPIAILTGIRMSPAWSIRLKRITPYVPIAWARRLHFPVMVYFVAFTFVHVVLVAATGLLRNLNHMYANRDDVSWVGFWVFLASVAVMVGAWIAARPVVLRAIAGLGGTVSRR